MKKLNYELKEITTTNRDGSHTTQSDRHQYLQLMARQLHKLGYRNMGASSLKRKHVLALVRHWQSEVSSKTGSPISNGTIKNRMAVLRWWARKVNKPNVVPSKNKELGIADRLRMPVQDKAFSLTDEQKRDLPTYLNLSARLQEEFGLRREEAAKFNISKAEYENHIKLMPSWTKGGRERTIPITNEEQRVLINEVRNYAPSASLIPSHMSYAQYLSHQRYIFGGIGIPSGHGLRHHYAQQRYITLAKGLEPPRLGGRTKSKLTEQEKEWDSNARLIVSSELGHTRVDIARIYLG